MPPTIPAVSIPLILAGPMVRNADEQSVTVWVALSEPGPVTLEVWEALGGQPGASVATSEASKTVALGPKLHLVAVTAYAAAPLRRGQEYLYDLQFTEDRSLKTAGVLGEGTGISAIAYPGRALPGLRLMAGDRADLRIAHGSCRKPHGKGEDALALLDAELQAALGADPRSAVQALFLTGDQIYADDVHPELLEGIQTAAVCLLGGDPEATDDLKAYADQLKVGKRASFLKDVAHFTSGAADRDRKSVV